MSTVAESTVLLADGVWIGTALLHQKYPEREDLSEAEIQAVFLDEGTPLDKDRRVAASSVLAASSVSMGTTSQSEMWGSQFVCVVAEACALGF